MEVSRYEKARNQGSSGYGHDARIVALYLSLAESTKPLQGLLDKCLQTRVVFGSCRQFFTDVILGAPSYGFLFWCPLPVVALLVSAVRFLCLLGGILFGSIPAAGRLSAGTLLLVGLRLPILLSAF